MIKLIPLELLFLGLLLFVYLANGRRRKVRSSRGRKKKEEFDVKEVKPYFFGLSFLFSGYLLVSLLSHIFNFKHIGELGNLLASGFTHQYGAFWSILIALSFAYLGLSGMLNRIRRSRALKLLYLNLLLFFILLFWASVGLGNPQNPSMRSIWTLVSLLEPILGLVGIGFIAVFGALMTLFLGLGVRVPRFRQPKLKAWIFRKYFRRFASMFRDFLKRLKRRKDTGKAEPSYTPEPSSLGEKESIPPISDMPYAPPELEETERPPLELEPQKSRPATLGKQVQARVSDEENLLEQILVPRSEILSLLAVPSGGSSVDEDEFYQNARLIEEKLEEFGIRGRVVGFNPGPVVTLYEYEPAPGIKISRILNLADDLALRMKSNKIRIVAPLLNKGLIGIEVPNRKRRIVYFRELAEDERFRLGQSKLKFALGVDTGGRPFYADLAKMPHLLIAGATGSGKSVCINSILTSILFRARPSEVRLLLIDPKRIELSFYEGIPHLLLPVVKDRKMAGHILKQAVIWMDLRYKHFARDGVRDIESHNRTALERGDKPIPYVVIVIDEFADLILTIGKDIEEPLARLAQMARAVGIHLVVATQRPSVDVITGIIKANFPVRIAFKVPSKVDSRTILDETGAEKLLGMGDMLFIPPGTSEPVRLHGPFVSEEETRRIAHLFVKEYLGLRFKLEFGDIPEIESLVERLVEDGFTPALTRTDEPGLEERFDALIGMVASALNMEPEVVAKKLRHIRETYYQPLPEMLEVPQIQEAGESPVPDGFDPLLVEAIRLATARGEISATMIQRKLRVGFARAARIVDQMEELGIVTPPSGSKPRRTLLDLEAALERLRNKGR